MDNRKFSILLLGNGGREHALAWKLSQSPSVAEIYVVPGNGGTATLSKVTNVENISLEDFPSLVQFARKSNVNLLIPGPEAPLVAGVVDFFRENVPDMQCFGPSKAAARLEGSKAFSKEFMRRHGIPTAAYEIFNDYEKAMSYLNTVSTRVVIKASGLAAGKGVIIPTSKEEAQNALKTILLDKEFGAAGNEVVIEEYLEGEELSILSFCDGNVCRSLPATQDFKRVFDDDQGPNTGGMGSYAPAEPASEEVMKAIDEKILRPTLSAMRADGHPFIGLLFTGIMVTVQGLKVLEYNVRFGDPETQSLMPLLRSDLADIMLACTNRSLNKVTLEIEPKSAVTIVAAAAGYPQAYAKGTEIKIDETPTDTVIFHAGTSMKEGLLRTSGGRVIAATAYADELEIAVNKAYNGIRSIDFDGIHFRTDIAARAVERLKSKRS